MKNATTIELEKEAYFQGRFPFGDCVYYFDRYKQEIGFSHFGLGIRMKREWHEASIDQLNLTQIKFA
jgi:hypothetical protein